MITPYEWKSWRSSMSVVRYGRLPMYSLVGSPPALLKFPAMGGGGPPAGAGGIAGGATSDIGSVTGGPSALGGGGAPAHSAIGESTPL